MDIYGWISLDGYLWLDNSRSIHQAIEIIPGVEPNHLCLNGNGILDFGYDIYFGIFFNLIIYLVFWYFGILDMIYISASFRVVSHLK